MISGICGIRNSWISHFCNFSVLLFHIPVFNRMVILLPIANGSLYVFSIYIIYNIDMLTICELIFMIPSCLVLVYKSEEEEEEELLF